MKLPHELVLAPRIARLWGHDGWTLFVWTFVSEMPAGAKFVRHEYRHVWHWAVGTLAGAVLIGALCWFADVSWWWIIASPLGFLAPYFLSFIPNGYHGSWFERDAERYAERNK